MTELQKRNGIVTGGSRGIGKETTRQLVEREMNVMITGRTREDLERTASELSDSPGQIEFVQGDVSSYEDCQKVVQRTVDQFGSLDVLVNNAGIGQSKADVENIDPEEWKEVIDVNLTGSFYMSKEVIPEMKKAGKGDIVFIASLAGRNAVPSMASYAASKWGMVGFAKSLMLEVRQDNIKVGTVCPGSVETGFSSTDKSDWALYPEDVAKVVRDFLTHRRDSLTSLIEMRPTAPNK